MSIREDSEERTMKKNICLFVLIGIMILNPRISSANQKDLSISIDGKVIQFSSHSGYPFLDENNRTQVPFRVVLEAFGADVEWNEDRKIATAKKGGIKVEVPIGENYILVNGESLGNDTEALIVREKTYVPIRKVIEAFGSKIIWTSDAGTIEIITEEPSEELREMSKIIEKKVIFENDISVFTLYAFMNFTGYNDENNRLGYHPVRTMVREDLQKMNLVLQDNNYYTNKKILDHDYRMVLTKIYGAPDFKLSDSLPNYLLALNDLPSRLKEFYEKANIEEMFEKYNTYYQEELDKYSKSIYPALAKTNQFLRIDTNKIPEFYFQVNLLDAYWRGYGLGNTYKHKGGRGMIITGPSDEPNIRNVVHEYLHGIITPIDKQLKGEIEELSFLMAEVPKNTQATSSSYNNWVGIFDESLIRALAGRFLGEKESHIQNEMQEGFILVEYFDKRFDEFENYEGTLKEFIQMLIADLKTKNNKKLLN